MTLPLEQAIRQGDRAVATACIACGSSGVEEFLNLGETALANRFLTQEELKEPEPSYPLRVGFCRTCAHVQLTERVPPSAMFTEYLYISSASDALKAHLWDLSDVVVSRLGLSAQDLVMDIGCNDGTLLAGFQRHGVRVLGVDPAENLAALMQRSSIGRHVGFFNASSAKEIVQRWGQASAITMTNTFPHIPELKDFLAGIRTALAPGGTLIIEAHYLLDLLEQRAFDTMYHEHVSYWALRPMMALFERAGLQVVSAERLPLHHGQLRVFVQRAGEGPVQLSVAELLQRERAAGLEQCETYQRFARQILEHKQQLNDLLNDLIHRGKRVAGYGAPAKGNTLLSFLGIGPDRLAYIVDRSPLKQGRYTPGMHIPVVPTERLLIDQPDYVLLLAWNFAEEVMAQQAEYRKRGGRFIIPVPDVRII